MKTAFTRCFVYLAGTVLPNRWVAIWLASFCIGSEAMALDLQDVIEVKRVQALALSPDGNHLAFTVEAKSIKENRTSKTFYIWSDKNDTKEIRVLSDATDIRWSQDGKSLFFLSRRTGVTQLYQFTLDNYQVRQVTKSIGDIQAYALSPTSGGVAYIANEPVETVPNLAQRLRTATSGVTIDTEELVGTDFIEPPGKKGVRFGQGGALWLADSRGERRVDLPGAPVVNSYSGEGNLHWSHDGRYLSVSYRLGDSIEAVYYKPTGIGVYDLVREVFRPLAGTRSLSVEGGAWLHGEDAIMVKARLVGHVWHSACQGDVMILRGVRQAKGSLKPVLRDDVYDCGMKYMLLPGNRMLAEGTVRAQHMLREFGPGRPAAQVELQLDGSSHMFSFDRNGKSMAFVNESLTRPPEIYVQRGTSAPIKVTRLNEALASKVTYRARLVRWNSKDGTGVEGWLLTPKSWSGPGPVLTMVHGGPGAPMKDVFAPYSGYWPYPFEVLTAQGVAVFMPNYRGTYTFGAKFHPEELDGEPVDDIVLGIQHLITLGLADPSRLGIAGHSHGAWLGPLVMTRARQHLQFKAASFAEGTQNLLHGYDFVPDIHNRHVQNVIWGGAPEDNVKRYVEMSPVFHYKGLATATLYEAGATSRLYVMAGAAKASKRAGMTTEYVVYPREGHNLVEPQLIFDSAKRNLSWFLRWLGPSEHVATSD